MLACWERLTCMALRLVGRPHVLWGAVFPSRHINMCLAGPGACWGTGWLDGGDLPPTLPVADRGGLPLVGPSISFGDLSRRPFPLHYHLLSLLIFPLSSFNCSSMELC